MQLLKVREVEARLCEMACASGRRVIVSRLSREPSRGAYGACALSLALNDSTFFVNHPCFRFCSRCVPDSGPQLQARWGAHARGTPSEFGKRSVPGPGRSISEPLLSEAHTLAHTRTRTARSVSQAGGASHPNARGLFCSLCFIPHLQLPRSHAPLPAPPTTSAAVRAGRLLPRGTRSPTRLPSMPSAAPTSITSSRSGRCRWPTGSCLHR